MRSLCRADSGRLGRVVRIQNEYAIGQAARAQAIGRRAFQTDGVAAAQPGDGRHLGGCGNVKEKD